MTEKKENQGKAEIPPHWFKELKSPKNFIQLLVIGVIQFRQIMESQPSSPTEIHISELAQSHGKGAVQLSVTPNQIVAIFGLGTKKDPQTAIELSNGTVYQIQNPEEDIYRQLDEIHLSKFNYAMDVIEYADQTVRDLMKDFDKGEPQFTHSDIDPDNDPRVHRDPRYGAPVGARTAARPTPRPGTETEDAGG